MSLLKIVIDHTYSPARKRRLPAFCICLALLFGLHAFALDQDMLNSLPVDATAVYDFKIPPKPTGHVLDMAHFLAEEMIQSLDEELTKEAREHDVQVYLLIVPSVQKNALDPFTRQVADAWTKGFFGATIVFDDATGHVSIHRPAGEG